MKLVANCMKPSSRANWLWLVGIASFSFSAFSLRAAPSPVQFAPATFPGETTYSTALAIGDFNGDSKQDIILAGGALDGGFITVLPGNGNGTFGSPKYTLWEALAVGAVPSVAVGDFNKDGRLDVAAGAYYGSVWVFLGQGNGSFNAPQEYTSGALDLGGVATGDFNKDGWLDLVSSSKSFGFIDINVGTGNGTFAPATRIASRSATSLAVADLNADGNLDVVADGGFPIGTVAVGVLLGRGNGTFDLPVSYVNDSSSFVTVGDVNRDNKLDLVTTESVYLGIGNGTFGAPSPLPGLNSSASVAVADFNGDGNLDVVGANQSSQSAVSVLLGRGNGTFLSPTSFGVGVLPTTIATGDFDGDGRPDVATSHPLSPVSVLLNRTPANPSLPNLTPHQPSGWSDKIVVSRTTGTTTDSASLTTIDALYVDWAVLNNGTVATANPFYIELYVDGTLRNSWYRSSSLDVNYYTYVNDYSIGSLSAGAHTIKLKGDSTDDVAETSEADNEYTKTINVSPPPQPDFVVAGITFSPSSPLPGQTFTAYVTVANQGNGSGSGGRLDLWKNQSLIQGCGATGDSYANVGTLAVGASQVYTFASLVAPASGPPWTFRAFVDSGCGTTETNEGNNQTTVSYGSLPPPSITSVSPNPVSGLNSPQPFYINGANFVSGCNVTLRDLTANQPFPNRPIISFSSTQIRIDPNFTTAAHTWSVEVINPVNQSSGQFQFSVNAPNVPTADGFDYPIGAGIRYTHEGPDSDGWKVDTEFNELTPYGYHLGEDWNADSGLDTDFGLPVYAAANGRIVFAGPASVGGWGNVVIIRHRLQDGTQVETLYGHVASIFRMNGTVTRGEVIASLGKAPPTIQIPNPLAHLHFEVRFSNCSAWGTEGPGYSPKESPPGWTDPSDFIDAHRPTQAPLLYSFAGFVGTTGGAGSVDGIGNAARFNSPSGVALDNAGNVYVADGQNCTIRKVTPAGIVATLAGSPGKFGSLDGTGGAARFSNPSGVTWMVRAMCMWLTPPTTRFAR